MFDLVTLNFVGKEKGLLLVQKKYNKVMTLRAHKGEVLKL